MGTAIKHPVSDQAKPVICNFWHPGTLTLRAERQSARMSKITNDGLGTTTLQFGSRSSHRHVPCSCAESTVTRSAHDRWLCHLEWLVKSLDVISVHCYRWIPINSVVRRGAATRDFSACFAARRHIHVARIAVGSMVKLFPRTKYKRAFVKYIIKDRPAFCSNLVNPWHT